MSATQQDIMGAFYKEIKRLIGGVVGDRIYDTQAPQDDEFPLIVFTVVADSLVPYFIDDYTDMDIQVSVFGDKKLGLKTTRAINDTLVDGLHRAYLSVTSSESMNVKNTIRGVNASDDPDIIHIRSEYNVY